MAKKTALADAARTADSTGHFEMAGAVCRLLLAVQPMRESVVNFTPPTVRVSENMRDTAVRPDSSSQRETSHPRMRL